jgi:hypothetical protein
MTNGLPFLHFEYAQGGRFNYIYGGDVNNDGSGTNDLIYVPTTAQIIRYSREYGRLMLINQDKYLSGKKRAI